MIWSRKSSSLQVAVVTATALLSSAAVLGQQINFDPDSCRTGEVNISGATLFSPFFRVPASTNDFIDANCDGIFGYDENRDPIVQNLATQFQYGGPDITTVWQVSYRGVGSVNGFGEFIDFQLCDKLSAAVPADRGLLNRHEWGNAGKRLDPDWSDCLDDAGLRNPDGNKDNDSGTPACVNSVDLAVLDVPSAWAARGPDGDTRWSRLPGTAGYGNNLILSYSGWRSQLQTLSRDCNGGVSLNSNIDNPDKHTIFNTPVAWAAISYNVNRGVGRRDLDGDGRAGDIALTDLKQLFLTGRTVAGENLAVVTRSSGSGTRNGAANTLRIDPAWHRGDNLDNEWTIDDYANLGDGRVLTNAEGSGNAERALQVSRLGVGYTGLFGKSRGIDDATVGLYEIMNVKFDDRSGKAFVRPSIRDIVQNSDPSTGWQIGGPETFVSRGNPFQDDNTQPDWMENQAAAYYLRNILGSIAAFETAPNDVSNIGMPGEYLATQFTLLAACDALPDPANPSQFVTNTEKNDSLQQYVLNNSTIVVPEYGSVNPAGLVPHRRAKNEGTYADGSTDGKYVYKYKQGGNLVSNTIDKARKLARRNEVAGDFNYDHKRDLNDIPKMMYALSLSDPLDFEDGKDWGGDAGDQVDGNGAHDVAIVHVLGDFNGDGNFDGLDARYFADGLALNPNKRHASADYGPLLDRKAGFTAIDTEWQKLKGSSNFFGTKLKTGKAYAAGDARGDVAGRKTAPGADPRGFDGVVDAKDIDYVYANFGDWYDLDAAVYMDLSADMTGPLNEGGVWTLKVDQLDVDELVRVILGTEYGDANLDGKVDDADRIIVEQNQGKTGLGWAGGDFNGDGIVDEQDLVYFNPCAGTVKGDSNGDGLVDFNDIDCFVAALTGLDAWLACGTQLGAGQFACANDIDGSGDVNFDDIDGFVSCVVNGGCR